MFIFKNKFVRNVSFQSFVWLFCPILIFTSIPNIILVYFCKLIVKGETFYLTKKKQNKKHNFNKEPKSNKLLYDCVDIINEMVGLI